MFEGTEKSQSNVLTTTKIDRLRKAKNIRFYSSLTVFGIFVLVALLMSTGIFNVKTVDVSGNSQLDASVIKNAAYIKDGSNMFFIDSKKSEKNIEKLAFVKSAIVTKTMPNKISISITERKAYAYVQQKSAGAYLLIDGTGLVLEADNATTKKLPIITGLDFSDFVLGKQLEIPNNEAFQDVVIISQLLQKYNFSDNIKVDVSNTKDLHLIDGGLDISLGDISDMDLKIRTAQQSVAKLNDVMPNASGFIDASNINEAPFFRPLR